MNCRLCKSSQVKKLFEATNMHGRHIFDDVEKFDICRCSSCGAVFIPGLTVDSEYYKKYYPQNYYEDYPKNSILRFFVNALRSSSVKASQGDILKYAKCPHGSKLNILDIGCGRGEFLDSLDEARFNKYGFEINQEGYRACQKKHIHVFNKGLNEMNFSEGFFQVITLWQVIEHLPDPAQILTYVSKVLKKGGLLLLASPNTDSLGFRLGLRDWFHLDAPRHLILYNRRCLRNLLNDYGFEVLSVKSSFLDYPLDLFWSLKRRRSRFFVYPFYIIFKFFSRDTFIFICRKK